MQLVEQSSKSKAQPETPQPPPTATENPKELG
jgi:hypothetical protein